MLSLISDFGTMFCPKKKSVHRKKHRNHSAGTQPLHQVRMTERVLLQILAEIGTKVPEQGGVLGISKCGVISHFYYDSSADKTGVTYSPDIAGIRPVLAQWDMEDIRFCGMIHSHPGNYGIPSHGDRIYAERILKAMPRTLKGVMHMPIVTVDLRSKTATIRWYLAQMTANGSVRIINSDLVVDGRRVRGPLRTQLPAASGSLRDETNFNYLPQKTEIRAY